MRILAFFAKFTAILLILTVGVFIAAREILLLTASHTLKRAISELVLISHKGGYAASCRAKGITEFTDGRGPELQLRFISDTEYVLEVSCVENSIDPVLLDQKVLPPFVAKVQGSSGFSLTDQSAVELEAFGDVQELLASWLFFEPTFIARSTTVAAAEGVIIDNPTPYDFENGPITSCSGYGYFCCDSVGQKGAGNSIEGLAGCEKSCYSQCVSRPLVLSFTTSPFYDFTSRKLLISKGDSVEFAYVSDPGKGNTVTATIDFGDGDKEVLTTETGSALHRYSCLQARCEYTATITLLDNWGVDSAETDVSKVTIIVE